MALQSSGEIDLSDVNVELGNSSTALITMGSSAVRDLFGVASGAITMSDGYGASASVNYWGDSTDGATTISSNTQYTVLNKSGSYDGDMVVKNYSSLTINSGTTVTTDQYCRGMLIYVAGDCTINGTLSMTRKGAACNPSSSGGSDNSAVSSSGIRIPMQTTGGSETLSAADFAGTGNAAVSAMSNQDGISSNGTIFTFPRTGASGGAGTSASGYPAGSPGNAGSDGSSGQTGGGGGGGAASHSHYFAGAGAGSSGTVFAGGSGGGAGASCCGGSGGTGGNAVYGGIGGQGVGYAWVGSGGVGTPAGASANTSQTEPEDGVGGLLILMVQGDLTIGGSGVISSNAGAVGTGWTAIGGGGGGGSILVLHAGTLSNSGTVEAKGSAIDTGQGCCSAYAGLGGDGTTRIQQVLA